MIKMPALTVFIDEAGDPGVRDGLKYLPGRHEWFCLSAVVIRHSRRHAPVGWVKELRELAGAKQSPHLHFARIAQGRRLHVCDRLATKPLKAFCVASHKSNMREYINPKLGKLDRGDQFYNWCMRLLLERVTGWAAQWHRSEGTNLEPLEIVFARRGGHDYRHMFSYLDTVRMQVAAGTSKLRGVGLEPPTLERDYWSVEPAEKIAGCQLADTIASAIYQGANSASPAWDGAPAKALRPIIAKAPSGGAANCGMTVWPLPHQAEVPAESRPLFEHFGYRF
ncbi:DUF3800 domain-containing protein [Sphingomonas sp. CJ20]